ncbi:dihydrofolate reductase [Mucilaginibacter rigui]|uniref:Dihydrofolate reductase n=1 Tax=Mucilaginibacter rigui TaxID=534635 RepID=A0ABR7X7G9_9SPHI|nr:dihydrofolate reductase family protein [Mucilaginibacter rigui]MBD1385772.1 dihydrofolate reductase [Mucilaginibacter rigui]
MRKLVVSMNVTLNGYMAGPHGELDWHTPYWDNELSRAVTQQLSNADTLLLGRVTYNAIAPYWQAQQTSQFGAREDADYADMINRYEKVVFSKTLKNVSWHNSRLASRNIGKEITVLKKSEGKDLLVYGSGKLVAALSKLRLVDEYRLWVYPVALNKGRALFKNLREELGMQPTNISVFESGVVLMCYEMKFG